MQIGTSLKLLRKAKKLKQVELCKQIGITTTYISQIEKGTKEPSLQLLKKFAEYYGMSVPALFRFIMSEEDVTYEKRRLHNLMLPLANGMVDQIIDELFANTDKP